MEITQKYKLKKSESGPFLSDCITLETKLSIPEWIDRLKLTGGYSEILEPVPLENVTAEYNSPYADGNTDVEVLYLVGDMALIREIGLESPGESVLRKNLTNIKSN